MAKPADQEIVFFDGTRYGKRGLRRLDQTIQDLYDAKIISPQSCRSILTLIPEEEQQRVLEWIETMAGAPDTNVDFWLTRLVVHIAHQRRIGVELLIRDIRQRGTTRNVLLPARCFA